MKTKGVLCLIALFAAGSASAQQLSTGASASLIVQKPKPGIHWFTPARTPDIDTELQPVEGFSREAWATQVGWRSGVSAFPEAHHYSSRLSLLWFGHAPWRHASHPIDEE